LRCNKKNQEGNDNNVVVAFFPALQTKKKGNNNNTTITFFIALHQKIKNKAMVATLWSPFLLRCNKTRKEKATAATYTYVRHTHFQDN
jgi:hypothetical protein